MEQNNAIEVKDITKSFKIYHDKGNMLKERALHWSRNKYEEHKVLRGISFNVKKGEAIGLIGHNGCGKSTTLKMLTRIMYPDSGTIEMSGRVSSLLELGAGFHPDMSGRENIYINASIFGLSRREIDERINDIISFSELEQFIDNPVRTYSSGMYMRLAFSVAINVNADILLIDEILAVGDVNFQTKCFNKMMEIKGNGTTIVLVSHSTAQIERICDRSIWIHEGVIREDGNPIDVHRKYTNFMHDQRNVFEEKLVEATEDTSDLGEKGKEEPEAPIIVESVSVRDANGDKKKVFCLEETVNLELKLNATETIEAYFIELNVVRADGMFCFGCATTENNQFSEKWEGKKTVGLELTDVKLLTGKYHFDLHIASPEGKTIYFGGNIAEFEVDTQAVDRGIVYLEHRWTEG